MDGSKKESDAQPDANRLITLKVAAKLSGLSYSHFRHLARSDEIWAIKPGNTWLTTEQAVRDYLARDRRPGPKSKNVLRSGSKQN